MKRYFMAFYIKNRIRAVRKEQGLSCYRLSQMAKVTRQQMGRIEKNDALPTVALMKRICRALESPPEKLFWLDFRS